MGCIGRRPEGLCRTVYSDEPTYRSGETGSLTTMGRRWRVVRGIHLDRARASEARLSRAERAQGLRWTLRIARMQGGGMAFSDRRCEHVRGLCL
jgi:hypothetical protein